ncbi:MAG: Gfo/Idh/MocA family oxidoreductase [Opitutaceae bacterium]|nr:Gfo/Idh/MocA family oxidoreductase [Opitutaceae bacterium]
MNAAKVIIVGTGGIARCHLGDILKKPRTTKVVGLVEINEASRVSIRELFVAEGRETPPFFDSIKEAIKAKTGADSVLIATPHKFHVDNVCESLRAGLDVFVEKPMVLNAVEARRVIRTRDKTGKLVVIGFPGSLSPEIKKAKELVAKGVIGRLSLISAYVHQEWKESQTGTWRQVPEISGGGFLFDTGSHMINTVVDLLGDEVAWVKAQFDNCGTPVEITSSVIGCSKNGIQFSLSAGGDSILCDSGVFLIGDKGVIETDIWGKRLLIKTVKNPEFTLVPLPKSFSVWEQFLRVRAGKMANPCPPEIGLRFAHLMDLMRKSVDG